MRSAYRMLLLALILAIPSTSLLAQEKDSERRIGDFILTTAHPTMEVLSQGSTGSCWSFATTSFLESEVQRITGAAVDLSEFFVVSHTIRE